MLPKLKNRIFFEFVTISFFPAILIFVSKVTLTFVLSYIFGISYKISDQGILYQNVEDYIYLNNITNILTFIILFSFSLWYLIKAYFLHESHISPKFSVWLAVQDLAHLVTGSMGIYLRVISYGFFNWLYTLIIAFYALSGMGSYYVLYVAASLTLVYTVCATLDIERDYLIHLNIKKELY